MITFTDWQSQKASAKVQELYLFSTNRCLISLATSSVKPFIRRDEIAAKVLHTNLL